MRADVAVNRTLIADDEKRLVAGTAGHLSVHAQAFAEFDVAGDMDVVRDERGELGRLDVGLLFLR